MGNAAYRWQGNAPEPDAERVEAIHAAYDPATADSFAEPARAAAIERLDRAVAATRTGDLTEAAAQLTHARAILTDLDPRALMPRRGLAGLFDSHGARLKRFRAAYARAASAVSDAASELSGRIEGATRRSGVLDGIWTEVRDAVVDLDAHLTAAARHLSGHTDDTPHPLAARQTALDACRTAALRALPLMRGAQGADARASIALKACTDGMSAWRDDWKDALGLTAKRPRKIKPDMERLTQARDDLMTRIDRALAELNTARTRRADLEGRMAGLRKDL